MTPQEFIEKYREAFGERAPLPIAFWYGDNAVNSDSRVPRCMIGAIRKVCEGKTLSLTAENVQCGGGGLYTAFRHMPERVPLFVSEVEHYKATPEQVRAYMKDMLPKLNYWKQYKNLDGKDKFEEFKKQLIDEINALHIEGMPKVEKLYALVGGYINLEYRLPNGKCVKFLNDGATYLGNQLECEFGGDRCFGIAANMDFILICTYEADAANPELVIYKKR